MAGLPNRSDTTCFNHQSIFRVNENYLSSVGKSIVELAEVIPGGLLIFFPSYELMERCNENWKKHGIFAMIEQQKPTFIESMQQDKFEKDMKNYCKQISEDQQKGAIFMAVLRAKISEGIDFSDMYGRAVLIIGIPFPPSEDEKIKLKQVYLNERRTPENQMPSGSEWYNLNAIKTVNQAIGRVIRHQNDYGAMLLCDFRYNLQYNIKAISPWVQGHLNDQKFYEFNGILDDVSKFFSTVEEKVIELSLFLSIFLWCVNVCV